MKRWCIAVVDVSRAWIYSYQDHVDPARQLRVVQALVRAELPFANEVMGAIERIVHTDGFGHVIVVASPKILGELRGAGVGLRRANVVVDEIPRDLARLTSSQAHDHLAALNLIPARQRVGMAR